jgi:arylsulfatase A-like enzyme
MLAAERWLQKHYKEKFFLYVYTWDPHEPWDPPNWYVELYDRNYDGRDIPPCYGKFKERGVSETELEIAHACYCGEITMVDRSIGRLLDTLEVLDLMNDTVIVFTTDHGFYFGEHGYFGKAVMDRAAGTYGPSQVKEMNFHYSPLYEEVIRVPLLIKVPGFKPRRTDALVSLSDLMPTILETVHLDIPNFIQGTSMQTILKGEDDIGKDFAITSWPLYNPGEVTRAVDALERGVKVPLPSTMSTREWTLVYSSEGYPVELYHLPSDPKQEKNVAKENLEQVKNLHSVFVSHLEKIGTEERIIAPRRML